MRRSAIVIGTVLACASARVHAQASHRPNTRHGFWIGIGLGDGLAGLHCAYSCADGRIGGVSGYFRLGATLSPSILIGAEANGWLRSDAGVDYSMESASVVVLWYPNRTGALYLKGGLGGLRYREWDGVDETTATAPSASLGIGYEVRLGRNLSLVPFLNTLASSAAQIRLNTVPVTTGEELSVTLLQFGVGVTWH